MKRNTRMGEPYIRIENLSFSYDEEEEKEKIKTLKNINLTIEKGSFVAILGHNGSGKSTLAKLINSILLPDEGKIYVDGMEVTDPDLSEEQLIELHRKVGMVFQNPDNQLVATVVEEDIAFGPENLGIPPKEIRHRVDRAMKIMGISEYAKHSPSKLSGGQKQRVAIAGLLAMQPECMIFDEATAMLDPKGRAEVMDMIVRLNKELGITVIHITHNMDEAALADRVIVMNSGTPVLDGIPDKVFSNVETMQQIGLDVVQGTELLYELNQSGVDIRYDETNADECAQIIRACYEKRKNHK